MNDYVRPLLRQASVLAILSTVAAPAQVTSEDYARAERMLGWNTGKLVLNTPVTPEWIESERFWYRKQVRSGHEFIFVDPRSEVQRPAFDHERLAASLSIASGTSYEPYKLPFSEFEYTDDGNALRFWEDRKSRQKDPPQTDDDSKKPQRRWTCTLSAYECKGPEDVEQDRDDEVASPDGNWVAFARDENLWIRSTETGEETQLSRDGEEHFGYAVPSEGCCYTVTARRLETKLRPIVFWSPDSTRIATYRLDERRVEEMHLLETKGARPILHSYKYALPGDPEVPTYTIHIFDIQSENHVPISGDPAELFWGPGDGVDIRWTSDGSALYYVREFRGHQKAVLYRAEASTGESRAVIEETSETFLDLPSHTDPHEDRGLQEWRLANGDSHVVWWSERDGWGHFYLFDAQTGEMKNRITSGAWVVLDIHRVDEESGWLYFAGLGKVEGLYPYSKQLYRVRLDGSGLQRLTKEDAHHEIHVSPNGDFFVDTYSTRQDAPVTVLRNNEGQAISTLERADTSRLSATGWKPAQPFIVKSRDGVTDLYGFLYRPSDFDPEKKYPVIDYIYPGPQIGPVRFRGFTATPGGNAQALAELGFVVIHFDATGTPFRSKRFHDVWYADMGDNGIIDHVHTIKQLAARYPEIDIDSVGIFGHSGGGFSSTDAILRFPDFFKVAVSGAGNHDNRSYSWGWGEKYQGLLEKKEDGSDNYQSQANHRLAENLKGRLLLTYGTLDDNVHPHATLLLIGELIKNNKDFDLLVVPNGNHRYASLRDPTAGLSGKYVLRRTWDYFVRHLLGQEPPTGYQIETPAK